jgi:tetratricopeptide (TPR) repeat protein
MLARSFHCISSCRLANLAAATALAIALGGDVALAQRPEGVVFVDDIETKLRKEQARQAAPMQQRPGAPAQRPMSPPPGARSTAPAAATQRPPQFPAPTGLKPQEPKPSWRDKFTFKNPFSKMFAERTPPANETENVARTDVVPQDRTVHPPQRNVQVAAAPTQTPGDVVRGSVNPRLQAPSRSPLASAPITDPFNTPSTARPRGSATTPLASGRSTLTPESASRPMPQEPQSAPVTVSDDQGLIMVSDLDDSMINQLPSIEGPVKHQPGMPLVVENTAAQTQLPYPSTSPTPPALASQPASPSAVHQAHEAMDSAEIDNQHVKLASATESATPRRLPSTTGAQPSPQSQRANGDATRARRAVPAHVPTVVENPVTPEAVESRPSAEKAIEFLTRASDLSKKATTEEEFTQVLQLCRSALAIDNTPTVTRYSNELAGWALNRRGETKMDRGEVREALLDFEDALRLDPKRWRALHNRGVIAAQEGRYAEAFDDFNHTIELNPKFAKAYSNRAALYVQAGDLQSALDDYQQAIAFDPELAIAHKGRAKVCHLLGDFDGALRHFDAAILLAPQDATIVNYRGDLQCDIGRYADAARSYRDAMEIDPNLVDAYRNLAWLAATCPNRELRNPEAALALANKMMELAEEPSDLDYDTMAAAHAISGDFETAIGLMDKAIEHAPADAKANYQWRRQLYEQGRPYITEPAGMAGATSEN